VSGVDDEVRIDIEGTAFMRGMMRRISGFLLEVGRGHRPAEDADILLGPRRDSLQWPVVLPAKGLCLRRVIY
jgi:tRNA pseudouridine38-40 synthase